VDAKGVVTGVKEKSVIDNIAKNTSATVTVNKDGNGSVTSADAAVKMVTSGQKATIRASVMEQIAEAAGMSTSLGSGLLGASGTQSINLNVTLKVVDQSGDTRYKIVANITDLVTGAPLFLYRYNTKTGTYKAVSKKSYTADKDGNISVAPTKKDTYKLVNASRVKSVDSSILSTIDTKKTAVSLKSGGKAKFRLKSGADTASIKKITYKSSKKSVATVSSAGKITAKKAGKTTVKAKITLKDGATKIVKMNVTVK
jgi:endo-1,4-beta-xylanase